MLEIIIIIGIVVTVAVMAGRSFYRTMTGKNDGCGFAGNCHSCACKDLAHMHKEQDTEK